MKSHLFHIFQLFREAVKCLTYKIRLGTGQSETLIAFCDYNFIKIYSFYMEIYIYDNDNNNILYIL